MDFSKPSPMLEAFLKQAKLDDVAADKRDEAQKIAHETFLQKCKLQLASSSNVISNHMSIPTKLSEGDLNDKTEVHPRLKGYDHSLERTRIKIKTPQDMQVGDIGEVMGDMFDGSNDVN